MRKWLFAWVLSLATASGMSVTVAPSTPSPAPLGTRVKFTATVSAADAGALSYRFRTRYAGVWTRAHAVDLDFRTVVDYGPNSSWEWTTIEREGRYELEVSAKNAVTGEVARDSLRFDFTKLATGAVPVVTPTAHPLVFIYSAPECPEGARMRIRFQSPEGTAQYTPYLDCEPRRTMNFYLAGMRANTQYTAQQAVEWQGGEFTGPPVTLTTSSISLPAPAAFPLSTPVPTEAGILLHGIINSNTVATDLNGNVVWYGPPGLTLLTRANAGGSFLNIFEDGAQDQAHQFFREFDLAGITQKETNAARVNEQLLAMGVQPITSFHHEAIQLPNGNFLVLAGSERILTDVQGPGPVDVLGDIILVFDRNLNVLWTWDAFDHLDPHRAAVLRESCTYPATVSCSAFYQGTSANDWLHGNALQLTPDGDILYSARHQDWIIKIDYQNGAGTGNILWRMGQDGDFQITANDPNPWFTHQHNPHFLSDNRTLLVFDNGNTRIAHNGNAGNSRGQAFRVDEQGRTVRLLVNADLKQNSAALGTAERMANGHYHFDAGFVVDPVNPSARFTQALETDSGGNIVWGMQIAAQEYRSFRMNDLYTPPIQ